MSSLYHQVADEMDASSFQLGPELRAMRVKAGLSLEEMADLTGVYIEKLNDWEEHTTTFEMPVGAVEIYARAAKTRFFMLAGETDPMRTIDALQSEVFQQSHARGLNDEQLTLFNKFIESWHKFRNTIDELKTSDPADVRPLCQSSQGEAANFGPFYYVPPNTTRGDVDQSRGCPYCSVFCNIWRWGDEKCPTCGTTRGKSKSYAHIITVKKDVLPEGTYMVSTPEGMITMRMDQWNAMQRHLMNELERVFNQHKS